MDPVIQDKIREIILENDPMTATEVLKRIMLELANSPASLNREQTVDRTIDMVCEECFG